MATERITDIGPPHYVDFLPPVIKENYGKWLYHETIKPGVMVHVAESGDKIYTVRASSPRLLGTKRIRVFADLAEKYCDGHLRFTTFARYMITSQGSDHFGWLLGGQLAGF